MAHRRSIISGISILAVFTSILSTALTATPASAAPLSRTNPEPFSKPSGQLQAAANQSYSPPGQTAAWDESRFILENSTNLSNEAVANNFTLASPRLLSGLSAWLTDDTTIENGRLDSLTGVLSWAIYSVNGDQPGTLLFHGQDESPAQTDTRQNDLFNSDIVRVDLAFSSPVVLPTGSYWLALRTGAWGSPYNSSRLWWQWAASAYGPPFFVGIPISGPATWEAADPHENAFELWAAPVWDQSVFTPNDSTDISLHVIANGFTLATPNTIGGFTVWLVDDQVNDNGQLDSFSGSLGWAIYTDDNGQPGSLIFHGKSSTLVLTDTGLQDPFHCDILRVDVGFPGSLTLGAGAYWFALHESDWGTDPDGSTVWWLETTNYPGSGIQGGVPPKDPATWTPVGAGGNSTFVLWQTPISNLSLSASDSGITSSPGGTIVYTLSYANQGNQSATGVVITEIVPDYTAFEPGASTPGWNCAPDVTSGSACTLSIGGLAVSGSGEVTFTVSVDDPLPEGVTRITHNASIADDGAHGADYIPANNASSLDTPLILPATVIADDQTITYGQNEPVFTFTTDPPIVFNVAPVCSVSGEHANTGQYPIDCSGGSAEGYILSYNPGQLTVNKADPTLSVSNSPVAYDALPHSAQVSASVPGQIDHILTGGAESQTAVGAYPVTANFAPTDADNYNALTGASAGSFVITNGVPGSMATTTSLTGVETPGSGWTLTALVAATNGIPDGSVIFRDGAAWLGESALTDGTAALEIDRFSSGSHNLTAEYQGYDIYSASVSNSIAIFIRYVFLFPLILR